MYLQLKQLHKRFDAKEAVRDLSFSLGRGELVSILGPSGCGKTTTLRMAGGFLRPDRGSIILDGEDITSLPPERRPTATVFQSYALFPHMTVSENVTYGLRFRKVPRREALFRGDSMLEKVGLSGSGDKGIVELSGGEQQRVALARALITEPKVLLMDEPLSNLDARLRVRMRREIRQLQRELAITVLYVTHDQEEALSLSDRVVVMDGGRLVQSGSPGEVYGRARTPFVADFIGRSNFLDRADGGRIAVHPEDLVPAGEGEFRGRIKSRQFKGAMTTLFVDCSGNILEVDVPSRECAAVSNGDEVNLSVRPGAGMELR